MRTSLRQLRAPLRTMVVASLLAACSSSSSTSAPPPNAAFDAAAPTPDAEASVGASPLVMARPFELREPTNYDASTPAPLVIGLHGYGAGDNAAAFERWFKLGAVAAARGFLYALPSGTLDRAKLPFWNAGDLCCNFYSSKVDDVAYLSAVIDEVARTHALDKSRVYVIGVSGGGIMAHRLGCDLSERIAGVFSVSGTTNADVTRCKPTSPVSIVEMHGDADDVLQYEGGTLLQSGVDYPGARETIAQWKAHEGCVGELQERETLDLESAAAGAETQVESFDTCVGGSVGLWTARGGLHAPLFSSKFATTVFDWFEAHPKKGP